MTTKQDALQITSGAHTLYRQRVETHPGAPVGLDISGRSRTSSTQTLLDGKIMNGEDVYKWDTKGSGAATYASNAIDLSVAAGQYLVRQSRIFCPYFSGKPQMIEITQQSFQNQPGVIKRFGYFSSSAAAPYGADYDGWWLEADGSSYWLITAHRGVETHRIEWTNWTGFAKVASYDWSKFTVSMVDFLWLGGAGLRLFMVIDGQFELIHAITDHAGYADTLIFESPNQPVRYEIRSSTGAGSLRAICSQVATEGAGYNEQSEGIAWSSPSLAVNTVGSIYALVGAKKQAAYRNHHCPVSEIGAAIQTSDSGVLMLLLNPTLSAPLTYTNTSRIQTGVANAPITVTDVGRILKAVAMVASGTQAQAPNALLRNLAVGIDNALSELVVAYAPRSTNQTVFGCMQVLEY